MSRSDVAEELGMMGTDKEPDRLVKQLIQADTNAPQMKTYIKKVAEKLGQPKLDVVEQKVKKLQKDMQTQLKKIEEVKLVALERKQREVWKCAACGRFVPQCTFMPYLAYVENI